MTNDTESALRACRLLQSSSRDSAEKLRFFLDEAIKQKYGSSKTITNVLRKEILEEEQDICNSSISSANSSHVTSQVGDTLSSTIADVQDDKEIEGDDLKDLLDLMCVVCKGMDVTAGNRLVECIECHSLYHQECHRPSISEADVNDTRLVWYCSSCKTDRNATCSSKQKLKTQDAAKSSSSTSGSSSSSSKSYSGSSSKSSSSSKPSSSGSSKAALSTNPGTSSSKTIIPNINIISADKRLQNMKRKAAKQHESKRKHSK